MSGTKTGGQKSYQTRLEKYGIEKIRENQSKGGKARFPTKGFGGNRERAVTAGRKGGQNRWNVKRVENEAKDIHTL